MFLTFTVGVFRGHIKKESFNISRLHTHSCLVFPARFCCFSFLYQDGGSDFVCNKMKKLLRVTGMILGFSNEKESQRRFERSRITRVWGTGECWQCDGTFGRAR